MPEVGHRFGDVRARSVEAVLEEPPGTAVEQLLAAYPGSHAGHDVLDHGHRGLQDLALGVGGLASRDRRADEIVEVPVDRAVHVGVDHVPLAQPSLVVPGWHPVPLEVIDVRTGGDRYVERERPLRDAGGEGGDNAIRLRRPRDGRLHERPNHIAADPRRLAHERDLGLGLARSHVLDDVVGPHQLHVGKLRADAIRRDVGEALAADEGDPSRPQAPVAHRGDRAGPEVQRDPYVLRDDQVLPPVRDLDDQRAVLVDGHREGAEAPARPRRRPVGYLRKRRVVIGQVDDVGPPIRAVGAAADHENTVEAALGDALAQLGPTIDELRSWDAAHRARGSALHTLSPPFSVLSTRRRRTGWAFDRAVGRFSHVVPRWVWGAVLMVRLKTSGRE